LISRKENAGKTPVSIRMRKYHKHHHRAAAHRALHLQSHHSEIAADPLHRSETAVVEIEAREKEADILVDIHHHHVFIGTRSLKRGTGAAAQLSPTEKEDLQLLRAMEKEGKVEKVEKAGKAMIGPGTVVVLKVARECRIN
jgi:hypothetical protein